MMVSSIKNSKIMELDFIDNSDNVVVSTVREGGLCTSGTCWGHIRHLCYGTVPNHGSSGAMHHSVNMRAFATSGPHCQCAAPCPEYKYRSRYSSRALSQGLKHQSQCRGQLSCQWLVPQCYFLERLYRTPMAAQSTPCPSAYMAPPDWPMYMPSYLSRPQMEQSSKHNLNVSYLLCNVRNWRLQS